MLSASTIIERLSMEKQKLKDKIFTPQQQKVLSYAEEGVELGLFYGAALGVLTKGVDNSKTPKYIAGMALIGSVVGMIANVYDRLAEEARKLKELEAKKNQELKSEQNPSNTITTNADKPVARRML